MQAAPSQAELLYKNFKVMKEKLKSHTKDSIVEKYGNAADEDKLPRELLLGQSERQFEYDRAGRIIKGQVRFVCEVIIMLTLTAHFKIAYSSCIVKDAKLDLSLVF